MGDLVEFSTHSGHQKMFYKIGSNGVNFQVKGDCNAGIALAKKVAARLEYRITIGRFDRSSIEKMGGAGLVETAETPNILSPQEYRKFWLSWAGNCVKLGGEGLPKAIVLCNCKPKDMEYLTFYCEEAAVSNSLHWKVEVPPILERPILKPLSDGELKWVPIEADTLVLPDGAVIGGFEKENLYIVRARHRGSLTPGKFVPSEGSAYISWDGESHVKNVYEVLVGFNCAWVRTCRDYIPFGAVIAGHSENIEHEKLYVGRAKHLGHVIPGKVQASHQTCYIAYEGHEISVSSYEILVNPEVTRSADTLLTLEKTTCERDINETDDDVDHREHW